MVLGNYYPIYLKIGMRKIYLHSFPILSMKKVMRASDATVHIFHKALVEDMPSPICLESNLNGAEDTLKNGF